MKLGLALSGGGIRGIAHAGVLKALDENNIKIGAIGGTSSGALIASLYVLGYSPDDIYKIFKKYAKDITKVKSKSVVTGMKNLILNKKIDIVGLRTGENLEKTFNKLANKKGIQDISQISTIPISIPAVDIGEGKEYVFTNNIPNKDDSKYINDISIGKAVRASSSFPAIFCPCEFKDHKFLDGGTLNNVPVIEVKKHGAEKVIAVNFSPDGIDEQSNLLDIAMGAIDLMGNKISEDNLEKSDFVLTISTDKTGLLDWDKLDSCYKYGYLETIKNINKIKEIIKA